jgi:hypothetical protein
MEEALERARRCPDPMPGEDAELEIRPMLEANDLGKELTPALRARESASASKSNGRLRAGNRGQGATASTAFTAMVAI